MELLALLRHRYSVRAYRPDPVPDELLRQVLEAAQWAPTACNRQPFQIIVIRTAGRETELGAIYARPWFVQTPLVICMCAWPQKAWSRKDGVNYSWVDATIAMDHLVLAATAAGLGTCWVAAFDPEAARKILELPAGVEPVAFTPLGYPADLPKPKNRLPLDDLIHWEKW